MFILLGRDRHAPMLVSFWAFLRRMEGEDPAKVAEAVACSELMAVYYREKKGDFPKHHTVFDALIECISDIDTLNKQLNNRVEELLTANNALVEEARAARLAPR